jgi:hypothetical protein
MGYYRHPKTTQERKQYVAVQTDQEIKELAQIKMRQCRSDHNLPNAWDDLWARPSRCWKEHRKTRFREKNYG